MQLGATFFEKALGPQCLRWLEDSVFSIREAATRNLFKLAQEFGPDWARVHLVPQVKPKLDFSNCTRSDSCSKSCKSQCLGRSRRQHAAACPSTQPSLASLAGSALQVKRLLAHQLGRSTWCLVQPPACSPCVAPQTMGLLLDSHSLQTLHSVHPRLSLDPVQVLKMVDNPHYLYRMTVLVAIASLAPVVNHDVLCGSMLPVVVGCSHDKVCAACSL